MKAYRSVPTSCLDPVESKLGFSHLSIFNQSAERAARAAPNGVKKGATFLLLFRSLNKGVLCTAYKKRGEEAPGFTAVRGAPQNGDGRVEADFAIMRLIMTGRPDVDAARIDLRAADKPKTSGSV